MTKHYSMYQIGNATSPTVFIKTQLRNFRIQIYFSVKNILGKVRKNYRFFDNQHSYTEFWLLSTLELISRHSMLLN